MKQPARITIKRTFPLLTLALAAALLFCCAPPAAAQTGSCDPATAMQEIQENPAEADKLMVYTVDALVRRLRCVLPTSVMDGIRRDPGSAELAISENAPDCYAKMREVYNPETAERVQDMVEAVTEALERMLMDRGCPRMPEETAAFVRGEYAHRILEVQFMMCVNELRRLASAQSIFFGEQNRYTADIRELAKWLVPSANPDQSAAQAEAQVALACCGAAGCAPGDTTLAWDAEWGMELDDGDFAIYGYPIGGPGCLILVTPDGVDPVSVDQCIEESEREDD
jgi:hypothetical protein